MAKSNKGSSGIDGATFEMIEADGVNQFLEDICKELKSKTYLPKKKKIVEIPKGQGKTRRLSFRRSRIG